MSDGRQDQVDHLRRVLEGDVLPERLVGGRVGLPIEAREKDLVDVFKDAFGVREASLPLGFEFLPLALVASG